MWASYYMPIMIYDTQIIVWIENLELVNHEHSGFVSSTQSTLHEIELLYQIKSLNQSQGRRFDLWIVEALLARSSVAAWHPTTLYNINILACTNIHTNSSRHFLQCECSNIRSIVCKQWTFYGSPPSNFALLRVVTY